MLNLQHHRWQVAAVVLFALVLLTLSLVSANPAQAISVGQAPAVAPSDNINALSQNFQVFKGKTWTAERMKAAKPYPKVEANTAVTVDGQSAPTGTPGKIEATAPKITPKFPSAPPPAKSPRAPTAATGIGPSAYSYPAPFNEYQVPWYYYDYYSFSPYITIGKLFFTQYGTDYVCSAASIGNYAVWTAGHCVHAGNNSSAGWSYNIVFVPGYDWGSEPLGEWYAYDVWTKTLWYQYGNPKGLRGDMGGIVLYPDSYGNSISDIVGALGFAWNFSYTQHWNVFGYPQAAPFDGQDMHSCQASYAYNNGVGLPGPTKAPKTQGIGCNLTGGASGGPWILYFQDGNYLNGDNSYYRNGKPNEMFSPHFDNNAKSLYDAITSEYPY